MYKTSDDLRFVKNRAVLQRAFIDLTLEKHATHISVKELTERAGVNRMTFYSHYDEVADVLLEFVDGLTAQLIETHRQGDACPALSTAAIRQLLLDATALMEEELAFYKLVAKDQHFELYRAQFRKAFTAIFADELERTGEFEPVERDMMAGMVASGITYAYLDWLAGRYGEMPLDDLLAFCERFIARTLYSATGSNATGAATGEVARAVTPSPRE